MGNGTSTQTPLDVESVSNLELLTHPSLEVDDELVRRIFRFNRYDCPDNELIPCDALTRFLGGKYQGSYPNFQLVDDPDVSPFKRFHSDPLARLTSRYPEHLLRFLEAHPEVVVLGSNDLVDGNRWKDYTSPVYITSSDERAQDLNRQLHDLFVECGAHRSSDEMHLFYEFDFIRFYLYKKALFYPSMSHLMSCRNNVTTIYHRQVLFFTLSSAFFWTRMAGVVDPEALSSPNHNLVMIQKLRAKVILPQMNSLRLGQLGNCLFTPDQRGRYHYTKMKGNDSGLTLPSALNQRKLFETKDGREKLRTDLLALEKSDDIQKELKEQYGEVYRTKYLELLPLNLSVESTLLELYQLSIDRLAPDRPRTEQEWYGRYYEPRIILPPPYEEGTKPIPLVTEEKFF